MTTKPRIRPEKINVTQSTHRQVIDVDCATKPPIIGPRRGPVKAALAKMGNANTRSSGDQRSLFDVSQSLPPKPLQHSPHTASRASQRC